jgi:8-oxo-dGTP pyrophosphatase MutT (NUDIX family)
LSASTWPPEQPPVDPRRAARAERPTGAGAQRLGAPAAEQIPAAVLVPLFLAGQQREPHLVLTRRRAELRRHAGEISFPGGRRDPEDAALAHTALREAEEEIGLARQRVSLIGELPVTSTFATGYLIHPFVGAIPEGVAWRLSAREVDAVLELPLHAVRSGRTRTQLTRRGITFDTDAYVVGEHLIWGATARIIEQLLQRLRLSGGDGRLTLAD